MKNKFALFALLTSSLALPIALLGGMILQYSLKSSGSKSLVIVNSSVAYSKQATTLALIVLAVLLTIAIVLSAVSFRRKEESRATQLAIVSVVLVLLISGGVYLLGSKTKDVERTTNTQQIQNFFETLQQKAKESSEKSKN